MDDPRTHALSEVVQQVTGWEWITAKAYAYAYFRVYAYVQTRDAHRHAHLCSNVHATPEQQAQIDTAYTLLFK